MVSCNRVDDNGVWGVLPDWEGSTFLCTAYLPMGYIAHQRGRGERKAQAEFLTRAKRLVAKGKPLLFVAEVDDIQVTSSNGVDQVTASGQLITENVLITVTRRGLTKEEERETMDASKSTQRFASRIVDKAAQNAGVGRDFARRWCLYEPYRRFVKKDHSKQATAGETTGLTPASAAAHILVKVIGKLTPGEDSHVAGLLGVSERDQKEANGAFEAFATELASLCRTERSRLSEPIVFSVTTRIGGTLMVKRNADGATSPRVGDVSMIRSVFAETRRMPHPIGCSPLKITADGAGKYTFTTKSPKDDKDNTVEFLESAASRAQELYASELAKETTTDEKPATIKPVDSENGGSPVVQPTLNIGLIGDVANGKSTMIRAITGKRTQSHSSEQQKHGMTIRLGFANASILHCQVEGCGLYSFRQDELPNELSKTPQCAYCHGSAEVVTRVSFIDCPGHAELMATMLSGASAFDAVILAAASNMQCPSPQARQHLEALRVASRDFSDSIAVAQTKAELLVRESYDDRVGYSPDEKLSLHASNARENLRKTVAAKAPFFPTCAPLGAGLEPLAAWLAGIAAKGGRGPKKTMMAPIFRALRSFDVNYAGTDASKMVGGVLGGNITGSGSFAKGETLEIRPGLVLGTKSDKKENEDSPESSFQISPLLFQAHELMTGKNSLETAGAGGLIALRTSLDPTLCANDRLIGSVIGRPGTLPPVWGPTLFLDDLQPLDSAAFKKKKVLKKGVKVRVHAGSATVTGHVVRVSTKQKKIELLLDAPICASKGSKVAIEAKISEGNFAGFNLVACGTVADGSICCNGVNDESSIVEELDDGSGSESPTNVKVAEADEDDANQLSGSLPCVDPNDGDSGLLPASITIPVVDEEWARDRFLQELTEKQGKNGDGREIISVPKPTISRDGGAHVLIENFANIAIALNREPSHLQAYLTKEAGLSCTRAGEQGYSLRVRIRCRGFEELVGRIIRRYASAYVACHQCKTAKTEFLKKSASKDHTEMLCRQCNARRFVPKIT